jgi:hypothetical protein
MTYRATTEMSLAAGPVSGPAITACPPAQAATQDLRIDRRLQSAAQWHTNDVLGNRIVDGDMG